MLLPQDLMQALSPSTNGVTASSSASMGHPQMDQAGLSWLVAAQHVAKDSESNYQIMMDFLNNEGGQADVLGSTFASDLRTLIQKMSLSLTADGAMGAGLSQAGLETLVANTNLQTEGLDTEHAFRTQTWSVEELLQFYATGVASGNALPPTDETLPHAILSAPMGGTVSPEADHLTDVTGAFNIALNSADSGLSGVDQVDVATTEDVAPLMDEDRFSDTDTMVPHTFLAEDRMSEADLVVEKVELTALPPSVTPGQQERTSLKQPVGMGKGAILTGVTADDSDASETSAAPRQPDRSAPGALTPLASKALLPSAFSQIASESSSTQVLFQQSGAAAANTQPAGFDTGAYRAEQRMFAGEVAQTASQATANRTADMLPRFDLQTSFGQQGWPDSVGRQLLVMSGQGISAAQIRLDPPELGSLMVKIQLTSDQQATVNFVSPHAVVREALEQQAVRLQDLLKEQGLDLVNVSVSDEPSQQEQESAERRHRPGDTDEVFDQDQAVVVAQTQQMSLIDYYV